MAVDAEKSYPVYLERGRMMMSCFRWMIITECMYVCVRRTDFFGLCD